MTRRALFTWPSCQVDSSVVRIEPRHPGIPVNFKEWDGMVRLCFGRKNKTLGGIFRTKTVMELIETNYKTYKALQVRPGVIPAVRSLCTGVPPCRRH